jgi:hypothetical protein
MQSIEIVPSWPLSIAPNAAPDVDDVRPKRCPHCSTPSRVRGRVVVQGHGCRTRLVVVLDVDLAHGHRPVVSECWQRRYRCTKCKAVTAVLPKGVMHRYLYSVAAIVMALFYVQQSPLGKGLSHAEAYDKQGMFSGAVCRAFSEPAYRWRSLGRWVQKAKKWWHHFAGHSLQSLLLSFFEQAGRSDPAALIEVATNSHVQWRPAM